MVPLQTASADLGPPLVAFAAFCVAGALLGALGAAVVRRLSNPVGKFRLLYAGVLFPFALLGYATLALLGLGPAVVGSVPGVPPLVRSLLASFAEILAAGAVGLVTYAPTVRAVRDVRDIDLSTGSSVAKMTRYVVGLSVILTAVLVPFRALPSGSTLPALTAGLVAVVLALTYGAPWLLPFVRSTRRTAGATADRIERLADRAGLTVRDASLLDTDDEETANAFVRGPPGYRRLFVTSTFLDAFDDDTATALLAITAGRLRTRVLGIRAATVIVAAPALLASVSGVGPRWPLLGVALGVLLVGFWASRRAVRRADRYAADRVGAGTVADALDRYADVHAMEATSRRVPNPLSVNVALGDRIDALDG